MRDALLKQYTRPHTKLILLYRNRSNKPLEFHVVFLLVGSDYLANPWRESLMDLIHDVSWKIVSFMNYIFKRLRKIAENDYQLPHVCLSLCPSVCRPVRMEHLVSHWTNFHEIWNLRIFRQFVNKTQVLLNLTKITCTLHKKQFSFLITSRSYILRMKNVSKL